MTESTIVSYNTQTLFYKIEAVDINFSATISASTLAISAIETLTPIAMMGGHLDSGFVVGLNDDTIRIKAAETGVEPTTLLIDAIQQFTGSTSTTVTLIDTGVNIVFG